MRKIYLAIALFTVITVSVAQTKSAGPVNLGGGIMTLKIDKNSTTSTVTVTLTGPFDKWFGIGFNASGAMTNGTDCLYYATSLVDSKITGQGAPQTDTDNTNNWTVSNTTSGTTRTLVLTRGFVGGSGDYTFVYNDNSLNVIWAIGSSSTLAQHSNANTSRGSTALGFTLGVEDFTSLDKITIAPNPSNGVFTISKNNQTTISKVTIFDINGKVVKVVDSELDLEAIQIDLSKYSKGVYFVEITNETDKVVRKIIIE
jgi:hypothetical protein